jgi:hypothetical protein
MDLHMALAADGQYTHLTADADTTLCGLTVRDLPDQAGQYCILCIIKEQDLLAATVEKV